MKNTEFGERLSQLMKEKGISQALMAQFCQTTQQTVSRWCNGDNEPDLQNVLAICAVLEETPNTLLGYREEEATLFMVKAMDIIVGHGKEYQRDLRKHEAEQARVGKSFSDEEAERLFEEHVSRFFAKYGYPKTYNELTQKFWKLHFKR